MKKVSVIGAGFVGATVAQRLAERGICDIELIDVMADMAAGKALDLQQSVSRLKTNITINGGGDFSALKNSDVIIHSAGIARKPGMTRDDLRKINEKILEDVCKSIKKYAPNCILVIVANPLDVLTNLAYKHLGGNPKKIVGMSGSLDGTRLISKIKKRLNINGSDISPMVIGEHGGEMVAVPEYTTIKGIPMTEFFSDDECDKIANETVGGGLEIVELLKQGSAFYGPGESVAVMVESILLDQKKIICSCTHLDGEYGIKDLFISVPVKLGKDGCEEIIIMKNMTEKTKNAFESAVNALKTKLN